MPYKVFVAGQSATAAEANSYLMRQSVVQFPDYAAAVAAYVGPTDGAQFVLPDGTVYTWASGAWRTIPRRGRISGTTDANGYMTVTHGLGIAPTVVTGNVTGGLNGLVGMIDTLTTTTFRAHFYNPTGALHSNTAMALSWIAYP